MQNLKMQIQKQQESKVKQTSEVGVGADGIPEKPKQKKKQKKKKAKKGQETGEAKAYDRKEF